MSATETPSPATGPASVSSLSGLFSNRRLWFAIIGGAIILLIISIIFGGSGNTWQATNIASGHPLALLVDTQHPATIYAGNDQGQVLSTSDGGQTWTRQQSGLPGNANAPISALLESQDATHLYAGTDGGVYASTDEGQHWHKVGAGLPTEDVVDALAFGSADSKTLFAGTAHSGVYVSHDGGATWQAASQGLPNQADIYGLTPTPQFDTIFAALIGAGIYVSHDGGASWQPANTGIPAKSDAFALTITVQTAANKSSITHLYAGTSQGFYSSTDGGVTWQARNKGLGNTRVISIASDPASALQLAVGTDTGVYGTSDGGATWQTVAQGLPTGQHVGAIAISRHDNQDIIFAGVDSLYRFPGMTSAFWGTISRIIIFGLLFLLVLWVFLRQNRVMRDITPASPPPGVRPRSSTAGAPLKTTPARGATSHIRGGPPPRRPPPPRDEQA